MDSPAVGARLSAARLGVTMLFIANALVFASIVTRYPELKDRFDLSELTFGLMVACGPVGSVVGSIVAGRLVARLGAVPVAATSSASMPELSMRARACAMSSSSALLAALMSARSGGSVVQLML